MTDIQPYGQRYTEKGRLLPAGGELTTFTFGLTNEELRCLVINNEVWFIAGDATRTLGHANPSQAIATHVEPVDTDSATIQILEGSRMVARERPIVNESGLYALVLGSKTQRAREYKHWVTSEVLPAIRSTGSYGAPEVALDLTDFNSLSRLHEAFGAALMAAQQEKALRLEAEAEVQALTPKADFADQFLTSDGTVYLNEVAKALKLTRPQLIKELRRLGVLYMQELQYKTGYEDWFKPVREYKRGEWVPALKVTRPGLRGIHALFSTLAIEGATT